ncbi:LacI family transcriptional regulator [Variovorax sp. WS11]|uniref:Bug family tripartite tricarboxylate transporter substrate binding protein n=1 Tax=Variovorax sp. WS11 TaxID=1105204 RepID=UPI000D0E27C7|nr:tripartite tricarboxylate transporter substrate binding protein [Variovorax sp. WS11]NDZ18094.1 tripartite tricarboxylate transporter substrate binding protein [Variovorax sp. WS11]PSL79258.1 LacI family transcriptional regulator [Variovorax sp. WS11]
MAGACAFAQANYPAQPIKLVVPFPPAGGTDVLSRVIANEVTQKNKWTFVIDNKPGAGGNIGLDAVAKARNDGYTLGTGQTANLAINPSLYAKMPFDALKDFAPVVLLASQPVVLVVKEDSPIKTLADLKTMAQAKLLTMASAGTGTVSHVGGEMFARRAGFKVMHIPYKGAGPALNDLLGGQTDIYFGTPPSVLPMVKAGKLRAIAVTSTKRIAILPDTPTIAESGYAGFVAEDWKAVVAPAGTSPDAIKKINSVMNAALSRPEVIARLKDEGSTARGGTAAELAEFMKSEHARWGTAVRESGAKLD